MTVVPGGVQDARRQLVWFRDLEGNVLGTTSGTVSLPTCEHCGAYHTGRCHRIKAIEYYQNGSMKRVEYHDMYAPSPLPVPAVPNWWESHPWTLGDTSTAGVCSVGSDVRAINGCLN